MRASNNRFFQAQGPSKNRQLFDAVDSNNLERAARLITNDRADVNHIVDYHDTDHTPLLAHALSAGYARMARLLIQHGADVNIGNPGTVREKYEQKTPLNCAITLELTINTTDYQPQNLSEADKAASNGIVELLLQSGANPNKIGRLNEASPFSMLQYWRSVASPEKGSEIFLLLIQHGGNISGVPERIRESFLEHFSFDAARATLSA